MPPGWKYNPLFASGRNRPVADLRNPHGRNETGPL